MVSERQNTNSQPSAANANRGSLHVLNLGPLLVGQLTQAINWSNDTAFKRPECKPWVDIKEALPSDAETAKSVTGDEGAPALVHEPATESPSEPMKLESQDGKILSDVVEIAQAGSSAEANRSDDVSLEVTPTPTVSEERSIAKEEWKVDEQPVAIIEYTTENRPELDRSQSSTEHESKQDSGLSPKSEVVRLEKLDIVPNADRLGPSAVETVPASKAQEISEDSSRAAIETTSREDASAARIATQKSSDADRTGKQKPHLSSTFQMTERVSFAKSASMHPKVEQSQDDYLLQLERLVVELNMELAQVRGEQIGVDPMEQMANRIIALNLENLALREKLQQSNP
jgi:hypothetical protein